MQQIIQLRSEDDSASIRARIDTAELSHVLLVVPRGCPALSTDQGLQLLRRAAEDAGVEIGLVVHDLEIREHAAAFGFPLFHSITKAQRTRWRMQALTRDIVQGAPQLAPPEPTDEKGLTAERLRQWWSLIAFAVVAACGLCFVSALVVPTANVRIVPSAVAMTLTTDLAADPSAQAIDSEARMVPARRLTDEVTGTAQIKTTKESSIPNAPSTGTVIFSNMRTEETLVPQGTIVMTSGGIPIRFTTTTTVTVPAGLNARAEVTIQAVDPGPTGNVKELAINSIEGSLALEARVINLKPTTSGSLRPVRVVTADDKKKVEATLLQQLKQEGANLLQKSLKPAEFLPPESVLVDTTTEVFDHAVEEPADVLNLRITAEVYGLAVDREDCAAAVQAMLQKRMQTGYQLLPNSVRVDPLPGAKYEGIALHMPIRGVGYATPQIDTGKVSRAIQGKTAKEAADYLAGAISLAQPPDIAITPFGWTRLPWLGFRIAVFVEPQTVGQK